MNKRDLSRFDRLVEMMDSQEQMTRIKGRLRWQEFKKPFTKEQLEEAWQKIKNRHKR